MSIDLMFEQSENLLLLTLLITNHVLMSGLGRLPTGSSSSKYTGYVNELLHVLAIAKI
jgi:hypothetical protein